MKKSGYIYLPHLPRCLPVQQHSIDNHQLFIPTFTHNTQSPINFFLHPISTHPLLPPSIQQQRLKMLSSSSSTATILSTLFLALSATARPTTPAPISSEECTTKIITTSAGTFCDLLNGNLVPINILSGNTVNVPRNEPAPISSQECTTEVITTSAGTFCKLLDGNLVPINILSPRNEPAPIPAQECTTEVITTALGTFCKLLDGNLIPISILSPRNEPAPISAQECNTEVITTSLGTFCKLLDGNLVPISVLSGNTINLPRDEELSERDDELVKKNDPAPIPSDLCTGTVITTALGTVCDLGNGNVVPVTILKE